MDEVLWEVLGSMKRRERVKGRRVTMVGLLRYEISFRAAESCPGCKHIGGHEN